MKPLEKFFYISLGLTTDLASKFGEILDNLVKQAKITDLEAKKVFAEFQQATKVYAKGIQNKFDELVKNTLESLQLIRRKDLEEIRKRIEELEKKLGK